MTNWYNQKNLTYVLKWINSKTFNIYVKSYSLSETGYSTFDKNINYPKSNQK